MIKGSASFEDESDAMECFDGFNQEQADNFRAKVDNEYMNSIKEESESDENNEGYGVV